MQRLRWIDLQRVTAGKWMTRAIVISALLAMLTPCPAWAKERSDNSEAQQIEQLRAMVLQLQDRVDGLERQLNERRTVNPIVVPAIAAPELMRASITSHGPAAIRADASEVAASVPPVAVLPVRPQTEPQPPTADIDSGITARISAAGNTSPAARR